MSDGQKRASTEPTLVIPKDALPSIGSAPDEEARLRREAPTLVPCPWCDTGMVTHEKRQQWVEAYPELTDEERTG